MPRQHVENTKEFGSENEAKGANKHANKRIIYWPPFWNKMYGLHNNRVEFPNEFFSLLFRAPKRRR